MKRASLIVAVTLALFLYKLWLKKKEEEKRMALERKVEKARGKIPSLEVEANFTI